MKLNKLPLNVIGLNRVGLNQIGSPSRRANTSDRPYIDPEVLASLVAVCICDGKSNNDPDRAVIKNLVDPDNPFVISNAAFKLNSGYGKYEEDFTDTTRWEVVSGVNKKPYELQVTTAWNPKIDWIALIKGSGDLKSVSLNVSGIPNEGTLFFYYGTDSIQLYNGNNKVTLSGAIPQTTSGYRIIKGRDLDWSNLVITQIPSHQGALVTDGVDDMITSTKTAQEMLSGSNEITVVSMVHQITTPNNNNYTNIIRYDPNTQGLTNIVQKDLGVGKAGIYGYSANLSNSSISVINNILGDKSDYIVHDAYTSSNISAKYSVQGWMNKSNSHSEISSVAWYWTIIANKVLTTDQINQVISYFNLDKHVKPDVYYDVKKQGLSNDTPEADWYLKDFSGNGHDMTLYNFAKKLDSGVGKYEVDFNTWTPQSYVADSTYTSNKLHITNIKGGNAILYTKKGANAMKVKITGIQSFNLVYRYIAENDVWEALEVDRDGIYELPASTTTTKTYYTGFTVPYYTGDCDITIEQIPDYEGALVSDGVNDYGYADNLPIYKDYTVAIDRAWTNDLVKAQCLTSKLNGDNFGSFSFELIENGFSSYSFGISNKGVITIDSNKKISYQSKYVYNSSPIISGNNVDGKDLFLFRNRDSYPYYAEAAIWSYILFPYTLSEFLLERQLKRYKLGTLYPGMIEWRPKVNINVPVVTPPTFSMNNGSDIITNGQYIPEGTEITIRVFTTTDSSVGGINEATAKINGVDIELSPSGNKTYYGGKFIVSSKQKIDITIDKYIRYEDIVQPYPAIINLKQDGKTITWGDKLKVGSEVTFVNHTNLLPDLYTVSGGVQYNGTSISWNTSIRVEKSMVFVNPHSYKKANEPNCILAPQTLRIPNSSYKILGYIPDLTGKGNHGRLNNFAYTEESGANEDGSIRFDGTDDHITISNVIGGKCIIAKVTINRISGVIYDQRRANVPNKSWLELNPGTVAFEKNAVSTYIDGILNHNVICSDLVYKTVNLTCELEIGDTSGTYQPTIGSSYAVGYTTNINLYEFMLFPDVPDEEEIKELNEVMGIENNIEVS